MHGQLLIVDRLGAIGERRDADIEAFELRLAQAMAEGAAARVEAAQARVLAEHQPGAGGADRFGPHDFVGQLVLEHAVLVNAGFVRERIGADNRLVGRHRDADDRRQRVAGRHEALRVDAGAMGQGVGAHLQRHHDFFERGIAGALADAVDGAFDLARARLDGGE